MSLFVFFQPYFFCRPAVYFSHNKLAIHNYKLRDTTTSKSKLAGISSSGPVPGHSADAAGKQEARRKKTPVPPRPRFQLLPSLLAEATKRSLLPPFRAPRRKQPLSSRLHQTKPTTTTLARRWRWIRRRTRGGRTRAGWSGSWSATTTT